MINVCSVGYAVYKKGASRAEIYNYGDPLHRQVLPEGVAEYLYCLFR